MPADTEELVVRISVIDDGSVDKIKQIQEALGKFPGVQTPEHIKRIREESKGMFDTFLKGFEAINQGPAGMAKFAESMTPVIAGAAEMAAGITAFAGATVIAYKEMSEFSERMVELGNIAKQTGIAVGDVQGILEQFSAQGVQGGAAALQGLASSMENLSRVNSQLYRSLMVSAGQLRPAMQGFLESLAGADSAEQRINRIWQAAQNVQRNTFAEMRGRGWSEEAAREAAARRAAEFGAELGQPNIMQMRQPLTEKTALEKQNLEASVRAGQDFWEVTAKIGQEWEKIKESVLGVITPEATEVLKGLLSAFEDVAHVLELTAAAIRGAWNAIPDVLKRVITGAAHGIGRGMLGGPVAMTEGLVTAPLRALLQPQEGPAGPAPGLTRGGHALGIPGRQHGGMITETGPYTLHAGEMVASAGETSAAMRQLTASIRELNTTMRGLVGGLGGGWGYGLGGAGAGAGGGLGIGGGAGGGGGIIGGPGGGLLGRIFGGFGGSSIIGGPGGGVLGRIFGGMPGDGGVSHGGGGGGGAVTGTEGLGDGGGAPHGGGVSTGTSDVNTAIDQAAKAYGLDPKTLKGIASIESSMQPESNRNKATQYKGLFQIGRSEWAQYGGKGNIYNPADNAMAAAHMLADHKAWFKKQYGRDPTDAELYMMHQQGRGFFTRGAMTNIGGNPYPGMSGPQTHESFMAGWGRELARREARFTGDSGGGVAPTVAGGDPSKIGVTGLGPEHEKGTVQLGGQTFHWASGGAPGHPSIPFGTFNIDFAGVGPQGASGWGGRLPPAVAGVTTGEHGNVISGGGATRSGVEIHSGSSNDLDRLYTEGCFGVPPSEWPAFKHALLTAAKNAPGGKLALNVHPGQYKGLAEATIGPRGAMPTGTGKPDPRGSAALPSAASTSSHYPSFHSPSTGTRLLPRGGAGGMTWHDPYSGSQYQWAEMGGLTWLHDKATGKYTGTDDASAQIGTMFQHANMEKFAKEARPSTNVADWRGMNPTLARILLTGEHIGRGIAHDVARLLPSHEAPQDELSKKLGTDAEISHPGFRGGIGSALLHEHVRRAGLDRMMGGELSHKVDGQARVHVSVDDQRTTVHAPRPSGLFRDSVVHRQAQMIPASQGPAAVSPNHYGGMGAGGTFG